MTMVPAQNLISTKHQQQKQNHHRYNRHLVDHLLHLQNGNSGSTYGGCGGNRNKKKLYTRRDQDQDQEEEEEHSSSSFGLNNINIMSRTAETAAGGNHEYCSAESDIVVGPMADQDESRTNSLNNEAAASSNSKDEATNNEDRRELAENITDQGWLQLSIGGGHAGVVGPEELESKHHQHHHQVLEPAARRGGLAGINMIELDLLPGGRGGGGGSSRMRTTASMAATTAFEAGHIENVGGLSVVGRGFGSGANNSYSANNASLMYFQQYPGSSTSSSNYFLHHHQQEALNWAAFRPSIPQNIASTSSASSSSSLLMPLGQQMGSSGNPYLTRQFQLQPPMMLDASAAAAAAAAPSFDFRVVNPPRRAHSGIWFTLQASQNQAKEPFLPQISKSFLRIKDGRMTVRLLIKYLVNKLRLDSESEIEITCRGQQLLPFMTLQDIRDNIWGPTLTLLQDSSTTTDHLMVLHYSRIA